MKLRPSNNYPPITFNANAAAYNLLGADRPRGDARRVLRRSDLALMLNKSPRYWLAGAIDDGSKSTDYGSLIDCLVLTPERFDELYSVCPATYTATPKKKGEAPEEKPWNRTATFCKEWEASQEASGKTCVKTSDLVEAKRAVERLQEDDECRLFLASSKRQVQVCVEYHDPETGIVVPIKCLIDLVPDAKSVYGYQLGDLKTAKAADARSLYWSARDHGYDVQAALYLDAYNAVTGEKRHTFNLLTQENSPPYEPELWPLGAEMVNRGRGKYLAALHTYCQCLKTKHWLSFKGMTPWGVLDKPAKPETEFGEVEVA